MVIRLRLISIMNRKDMLITLLLVESHRMLGLNLGRDAILRTDQAIVRLFLALTMRSQLTLLAH